MMTSKLFQFRAKACEASKLMAKYGSDYWKSMDLAKHGSDYWKSMDLAKHGSDYYKQLLEKNKHYIQEPPTVEQCNLLVKRLRYTRLASVPARYEALWKEFNQVKQFLKKRKELKVQDAGIATLFGLECFLLFKAGEIIGRGGTITGYHV